MTQTFIGRRRSYTLAPGIARYPASQDLLTEPEHSVVSFTCWKGPDVQRARLPELSAPSSVPFAVVPYKCHDFPDVFAKGRWTSPCCISLSIALVISSPKLRFHLVGYRPLWNPNFRLYTYSCRRLFRRVSSTCLYPWQVLQYFLSRTMTLCDCVLTIRISTR